MSTDISEKIMQMFEERGGSQYGGEAVTQLEHALQAAQMAEAERAPATLIAAALLHDVGHLLHNLPDDAPDHDVDDQHEELAARWLGRHFPDAVVEPVRLHVAAKRYLCARDREYFQQLSPPSVQSLRLQGGPMSDSEANEFESHPFFNEAIRLRRWDEAAKRVGHHTPDVRHFQQFVRGSAGGIP